MDGCRRYGSDICIYIYNFSLLNITLCSTWTLQGSKIHHMYDPKPKRDKGLLYVCCPGDVCLLSNVMGLTQADPVSTEPEGTILFQPLIKITTNKATKQQKCVVIWQKLLSLCLSLNVETQTATSPFVLTTKVQPETRRKRKTHTNSLLTGRCVRLIKHFCVFLFLIQHFYTETFNQQEPPWTTMHQHIRASVTDCWTSVTTLIHNPEMNGTFKGRTFRALVPAFIYP